jgi:hypothetical protein
MNPKTLTALTYLNLRNCDRVSDNGLWSLASLTALNILDLCFCVRVSNDGLRALAGLTAFTNLDLCACSQVVRRRIAGIGRPHRPHRTQLGKLWPSVRQRVTGTGRPHPFPRNPPLNWRTAHNSMLWRSVRQHDPSTISQWPHSCPHDRVRWPGGRHIEVYSANSIVSKLKTEALAH